MYKQHLFNPKEKTQVYIKSNCAFTCVLLCFGVDLGHPQACQYKNLTKKGIIKSKEPLVHNHYFLTFIVLKQNINYKI